MATMEKLMKAFESLKSFQQQQGPPTPHTQPHTQRHTQPHTQPHTQFTPH
uniref:Huntingtin n=1 Tax=Hucho hucho TaxID=62062 RepID=A0A4W5LC68_9TELE